MDIEIYRCLLIHGYGYLIEEYVSEIDYSKLRNNGNKRWFKRSRNYFNYNKPRCHNYCSLLDGNVGSVAGGNCVEKWYNSGSIFNDNDNNNYHNNNKAGIPITTLIEFMDNHNVDEKNLIDYMASAVQHIRQMTDDIATKYKKLKNYKQH